MLLDVRMEEIIQGKRRGRGILWFLSLLYKVGIKLRHVAYDAGVLRAKKVKAVVVSVGNIVAGGAGKTPLVYFLADQLSKENKVAIVSRGYRSRAEDAKTAVLVNCFMKAEEIGDEPLWLAQKLPSVQVWVSPHREWAAQKAVEMGAEVILLDDGFQHRQLHRDFDIVVVSADAPYSNGYFLPRGFLRDFPNRLMKASIIAVMGCSSFNCPAPTVYFNRTTTLSLEGKKVALFCAIANPERFIHQVQEAGAQIILSLLKRDHDFFSLEELQQLALTSKADYLVCTEKDFVKIPAFTAFLPIIPIPLTITIAQGQEKWDSLIKQINNQVQHVRLSSHAS